MILVKVSHTFLADSMTHFKAEEFMLNPSIEDFKEIIGGGVGGYHNEDNDDLCDSFIEFCLNDERLTSDYNVDDYEIITHSEFLKIHNLTEEEYFNQFKNNPIEVIKKILGVTKIDMKSYWYGVFIVTDILRDTKEHEDTSCDDMFALSQVYYDEYLKSSYNVDTKSEYDCIRDFLNNKKEEN